MKQLQGKVALVTGATRGVGKGIAVGLGEAGAIVYITGRSLQSETGGSLQETQALVEQAGGVCIPVQVDHSNDQQVHLLFDQIQTEQGKLDILVNNVYGGAQALTDVNNKPFWECDPSLWDACNNVGLRSHYIASVYAAEMMTVRRQGLICTISSWGGLAHLFSVAYGVGKSACDRLAADMAIELKPYNITSVSLYPGIVGTELMIKVADQLRESEIVEPSSLAIRDHYNWETPLLTGRAIAALAADPNVLQRTGTVQIVAELAQYYRLVDEDNTRPVSLRSLRFILPFAIPALRNYSGFIPNLNIPGWLILLGALRSLKISIFSNGMPRVS